MSEHSAKVRIDDNFTLVDVGSTLLEELAKGLYQPEEVLREYVQNAIDAHRMWMDQSGREPEGPVQIEIRGNKISIMDYGIGMDETDIRRVKSIAVSRKRDSEIRLTGHKGVGIWAGLSYFKSLKISSTKRGCAYNYSLVINFRDIVDAISDEADIGAVLNPNYYIERSPADVEEHRTTVTLEDPTPETSSYFLVPDKLRDSIRRICPCELYGNLHFLDKLTQWYEKQGIRTYPIHVDKEPVYRSYPGSLDADSFDTGELLVNQQKVAVFWKVPNRINNQLKPGKDELAGFRILQSEFAIGTPNLYGSRNLAGYSELTKAATGYLDWYAGEIYVTVDALRPNLRREAFEESGVTRQFVSRLRDWYTELEREIRTLAAKRNYIGEFKEDEKAIQKLLPNAMNLDKNQATILLEIKTRLDKYSNNLSRYKGRSDVSYDISALRDRDVKRRLTQLSEEIERLAAYLPKGNESSVPPASSEISSDEARDDLGVKTSVIDQLTGAGSSVPTRPEPSKGSQRPQTMPSAQRNIDSVAVPQPKQGMLADIQADEEISYLGDLVTGLLAQILNEELADAPEVSVRILTRFQEQVRWVLTND